VRRAALVVAVVLTVLVGGAAPATGHTPATHAGATARGVATPPPVGATSAVLVVAPTVGALLRPVTGPVVGRMTTTSRFGPGHRGVDLAAPVGTPVRSAARGVVTFAGAVAGRRWVTVDHGWVRTTVGPLAAVLVATGDRVGRGDRLGTSGLAHGLAAVHISARAGDRYVDPLPLLRGRPRISLVPVTGGGTAASRPASGTVAVGAWRTLVR
jgi:murein DD-endopeptidase MepM/ murein hydrolase activator NlpD